ncbi:antibiotic biosynthesis monooxygenase [Jannaschia sp. S6380]|uniref:putative quinol monooxygenase n=1 Tax=Jannaschia sp. S6380 TaxID=2926408 RepID=UPI001FF3B5DB|nr:putative quinol monooxygenase [Jannaschia sp. S6380]MCK0166042.1 antibiotic biosynthesis monooxygenase [Jannaschia sp. S6380]
MFAVTVTIEVFPHHQDDFMPAMMANARASRRESACNRFDVLSDPERPGEIFLYEIYDDRAGFDAHHQTPHYKEFDRTVKEMIRRKTVTTFAEVDV